MNVNLYIFKANYCIFVELAFEKLRLDKKNIDKLASGWTSDNYNILAVLAKLVNP